MNSQSDLIKRIIQDLNKIDLVLMFEQPSEKDSEEAALLCELKSATDNLRTSMWCRMRASETQEDGARKMIEHHRTLRLAQLVRQYPVHTEALTLRGGTGLGKFEEMANTALQEHLAMPMIQIN